MVILFVLATTNIACNINFNEHMWIDERNYPGGPLAFLLEQQARIGLLLFITMNALSYHKPHIVDTVGNTATVLTALMADSLLVSPRGNYNSI